MAAELTRDVFSEEHELFRMQFRRFAASEIEPKIAEWNVAGAEVVTGVSMAKWWTTALARRLTAECLQLHGGYGFMDEYPISQDYADAAIGTIYAGTNEIMKLIIARNLGLG